MNILKNFLIVATIFCMQMHGDTYKPADKRIMIEAMRKIFKELGIKYVYMFGDNCEDFMRGPDGPDDYSIAKFLTCGTFATCPTAPPTCMNQTPQIVICNLGVVCLQGCNALFENVWISGCLYVGGSLTGPGVP